MNRVRIGLTNRAALVALTFLLGAAAASAAENSPTGPDAAGDALTVTTLASLTRETGQTPAAGLIQASDGNFYGTASSGGAGKKGTVFKVTPKGTVTALYSFPSGGRRFTSYAPLVQGSDGALYGQQVSHDYNTTVIFRLTLDGQFRKLHAFFDEYPSTLTLGRDGDLYGTSLFGGKNGVGSFFKISNAGVLSEIVSLDASTPNNAGGPPLEGDDGNFYLAAGSGGSHGLGGLIRISPEGTVTTLYEFTGAAPVVGSPTGPLLYDAAHEYLWGQTYDESVGKTVVFRYKAGTVEEVGSLPNLNVGVLSRGQDGVHFYLSSRTNLYSFAPGVGAQKLAALPGKAGGSEQLLFNTAGAMYGTTMDGGTSDGGTIFKVKGF